MWALIVAAVCAGVFAGAAIYITAVEHPAKGVVRQRRRAARVRPELPPGDGDAGVPCLVGCLSGLWSAWVLADAGVGVGALLLGAVVPFTLVVILPTNTQLADPSLDSSDASTTLLLMRWGRLHAVRRCSAVSRS